jgi:diaminopimelate epimerase
VLYEDDPSLRRPVLKIDTGAGLLSCAVEVDGAASGGAVRSVAVEMGKPRLLRGEVPMIGPPDERALRTPVELAGRHFTLTAVSMGNPHAVIFIDDPGLDLRELAETFGPRIETSPVFPRRTNVEFARVRAGAAGPEIDVVVWERGCGITLACGTGACATAVAASMEGRLPAGAETPVHVPGGTLFITVRQERSDQAGEAGAYGSVLMRGPARRVFEAELDALLVNARKQGANQAQR